MDVIKKIFAIVVIGLDYVLKVSFTICCLGLVASYLLLILNLSLHWFVFGMLILYSALQDVLHVCVYTHVFHFNDLTRVLFRRSNIVSRCVSIGYAAPAVLLISAYSTSSDISIPFVIGVMMIIRCICSAVSNYTCPSN